MRPERIGAFPETRSQKFNAPSALPRISHGELTRSLSSIHLDDPEL
jgi:hypothetical protein